MVGHTNSCLSTGIKVAGPIVSLQSAFIGQIAELTEGAWLPLSSPSNAHSWRAATAY